MDSQFDALKRQATKLERTLEDKVARYQQVREVETHNMILLLHIDIEYCIELHMYCIELYWILSCCIEYYGYWFLHHSHSHHSLHIIHYIIYIHYVIYSNIHTARSIDSRHFHHHQRPVSCRIRNGNPDHPIDDRRRGNPPTRNPTNPHDTTESRHDAVASQGRKTGKIRTRQAIPWNIVWSEWRFWKITAGLYSQSRTTTIARGGQQQQQQQQQTIIARYRSTGNGSFDERTIPHSQFTIGGGIRHSTGDGNQKRIENAGIESGNSTNHDGHHCQQHSGNQYTGGTDSKKTIQGRQNCCGSHCLLHSIHSMVSISLTTIVNCNKQQQRSELEYQLECYYYYNAYGTSHN